MNCLNQFLNAIALLREQYAIGTVEIKVVHSRL